MLPVVLNRFLVGNVLSFHLAAPPVRLLAHPVHRFLFAANVMSSSVAAFISINGPLERDKFKLAIHHSREHAVIEAERLHHEAEHESSEVERLRLEDERQRQITLTPPTPNDPADHSIIPLGTPRVPASSPH